ncbi:DP1 protein [Gonium pectorale]|uniref:DP1 protein n=1 Tax=Gonium pectorale TaxID=33097 RepID=A0A150H2I9_GONPE|nr:DP1 protein [Gonium pectorale]|eukprot:KXZ56291.1 DP1 protein [Gonium pectorale]
MEEAHQPKAEPTEPGQPGSLGMGHYVQDLQEAGLLEFATEVDFNRLAETPVAGGLPLPRPSPVGFNNPPPQPTLPMDLHQCHMANQASDLATARAAQVLHLARVSLHKLNTSYNPRATGSGGTDNSSKRRKTSRGPDTSGSRSGNKGLRHFSMKVCEKVEAKVRTTYNEVADELVEEMGKIEAANKNGQYDEKNIRRRVYDAINVLMAMNIIQKEKKEITWKGFPKLGNSAVERLRAERQAKIKEDMIEQQQALKRLLDRSSQRGHQGGTQLFLPFILVQAKPEATVEVKISEDLMDVQFEFGNNPFQIHDDSHVLKKMAEHQVRQPPQPPFPVAGGLVLAPWQQPNGAAGPFLARDPLTDAATLQLAVAAAHAQGNALAYGYPPAVMYQQQQQLLQQQQQQQQQQQAGQAAVQPGQAVGAGGAQGQPVALQPGGQPGQQAPNGAVAAQAQGGAEAGAGPGAAPGTTAGQAPAPTQQQLQQLHALQVQIQHQQQLQAHLQMQHHVRAGLPPLALPPLGAPLGHGGGPPHFSLPHPHPLHTGPPPPQPGQMQSLPVPAPLLPPTLQANGMAGPPRLGLPQLPPLQQAGQLPAGLMPMPQIPANLAAALSTAAAPPAPAAAPPPQQPAQAAAAAAAVPPPAAGQGSAPLTHAGGGAAPPAPGPEVNGNSSSLVGLAAQSQPPTHGLPMAQLVVAAPAAAFPLVA